MGLGLLVSWPECADYHSEPGLFPTRALPTSSPSQPALWGTETPRNLSWGADLGGSLGQGVQREPEQSRLCVLVRPRGWPAGCPWANPSPSRGLIELTSESEG